MHSLDRSMKQRTLTNVTQACQHALILSPSVAHKHKHFMNGRILDLCPLTFDILLSDFWHINSIPFETNHNIKKGPNLGV